MGLPFPAPFMGFMCPLRHPFLMSVGGGVGGGVSVDQPAPSFCTLRPLPSPLGGGD